MSSINFAVYRNCVIVNWLLTNGNSAGTTRNIKIEDLNLQDGYVALRKVKNRKQRMIPFGQSIIEILKEYL